MAEVNHYVKFPIRLHILGWKVYSVVMQITYPLFLYFLFEYLCQIDL